MCSLLHYSEEIQVKPNEDETFNWDLIQTVPACVINVINMISKIWYYLDFVDKCIYIKCNNFWKTLASFPINKIFLFFAYFDHLITVNLKSIK